MEPSAPGWYPDPSGRHERRYWSGFRWTRHVADGRDRAEDPLAVGPGDRAPAPPDPDLPTITPTTGTGRPAHVAPDPWTEPPRRSRRPLLLFAAGGTAVVIAALAVFFVTSGGDDDSDDGDTVASETNDDPLEAYLVEFSLRASGGTIDEHQANCMADNVIATIGRDRLMAAGVLEEDSPLEALEPDEAVVLVTTSFDCLEDEEVVDYMAATWNPSLWGGIPDSAAPCLFQGWIERLGRERMFEVIGRLAIPENAVPLQEILNPQEFDVFIEVLNNCTANQTTTSAGFDDLEAIADV